MYVSSSSIRSFTVRLEETVCTVVVPPSNPHSIGLEPARAGGEDRRQSPIDFCSLSLSLSFFLLVYPSSQRNTISKKHSYFSLIEQNNIVPIAVVVFVCCCCEDDDRPIIPSKEEDDTEKKATPPPLNTTTTTTK